MLLSLFGCILDDLGKTCDDVAPARDAVPVTATCTVEATPITDGLVELTSATTGSTGWTVAAARMRDGNGDGTIDPSDPMQLVVGTLDTTMVFDTDGTPLYTHAGAYYRIASRTADVDPESPGTEAVATGYARDGVGGFLDVLGADAELASHPVGEESSLDPWVTDLDGDGLAEALVGGHVVDVATGATVFGVGGAEFMSSADLDRDGAEEILGFASGDPTIWSADGTVLATFTEGRAGDNMDLAVGNLDDDDDGEIVFVLGASVFVGDVDGTVIARTTEWTGGQIGLVGVAELDGDAGAEVLVGGAVLTAFDTDLTPLWTVSDDASWHPFSVADLDGDGIHEVLLRKKGSLEILDGGTGTVLASERINEASDGWKSQPVVADVDADGLAEIVIPGEPVEIVESAGGGWAVADALNEWSGGDRHPRDRTESGAVRGPDAFWLEPGANVWQGLAIGLPPVAELGVDIREVCVDECDGDAIVTVRVSNASARWVPGDVAVTLTSIDGGDELGSATLGEGLSGGTATYLTFFVPAARVDEGLRAAVDPDDLLPECDGLANEAEYRDSPCP